MQITLKDVHFSYPAASAADIPALRGVSLEIQPGEQVLLAGRNGSGKTTLARCLNGLLHPQRGAVRIGDWNAADHTTARLARRVAYLFQNPDEQIFARRVWDEVAFGPRNLGYGRDRTAARVEAALEQVDLSPHAAGNPRDLGYSQRKRLALACALAMDTPILVLDEPTGGLDAGELERLAAILADLRLAGKTVLLITHDLDFAAETMDRAILLDDGVILADGPAGAVLSGMERLAACGLAAPQMARLSVALGLPKPAMTVDEVLHSWILYTDRTG